MSSTTPHSGQAAATKLHVYKEWWEKPFGVVLIGIFITVVGGLIVWLVGEYYSQQPTVTPVVINPSTPGKTTNTGKLHVRNHSPPARDRGGAVTLPKIVPPSSPDDLSGVWSVTYGGGNGPLDVVIRQTGNRIVGTLVTGNDYFPAKEVAIHGTYDSNPFQAQQVCASLHFTHPYAPDVQFDIIDGDHMTESEHNGRCSGFPIFWRRLRNSEPD